MDGDVESESNVVIGADGYVKGRIHAETVVVSGRVDGSISAGRLEIIAGGCVEGDVHILDLVIEPGGRFNGSSEIRTSPASEAAADDAGPSNDMETPRAAKAKSGGKKPAEPAENSTTGSGGQSPSTA